MTPDQTLADLSDALFSVSVGLSPLTSPGSGMRESAAWPPTNAVSPSSPAAHAAMTECQEEVEAMRQAAKAPHPIEHACSRQADRIQTGHNAGAAFLQHMIVAGQHLVDVAGQIGGEHHLPAGAFGMIVDHAHHRRAGPRGGARPHGRLRPRGARGQHRVPRHAGAPGAALPLGRPRGVASARPRLGHAARHPSGRPRHAGWGARTLAFGRRTAAGWPGAGSADRSRGRAGEGLLRASDACRVRSSRGLRGRSCHRVGRTPPDRPRGNRGHQGLRPAGRAPRSSARPPCDRRWSSCSTTRCSPRSLRS